MLEIGQWVCGAVPLGGRAVPSWKAVSTLQVRQFLIQTVLTSRPLLSRNRQALLTSTSLPQANLVHTALNTHLIMSSQNVPSYWSDGYKHIWQLDWYDEDDEQLEVTCKDIIRSAIERKTEDAPSIEEAAKALDVYIAQTEYGYNNCDHMESRFIELSALIPYDSPSHDRFVDLVASLRQLPHWRGFVSGMNIVEAYEGACNQSNDPHDSATLLCLLRG